MERLSENAIEIVNELHTERLDYESEYVPIIDALNRLAEYEDTRLEPDEILTWKELAEAAYAFIFLNEYKSLGTIDHISELLKAEKDGRLVILPCKVGDTIYRCGDPIKKIYEWQIAYVEVYEDETVFVDDSDNNFVEADIGKTVFLTHEEAEKVLEEVWGRNI